MTGDYGAEAPSAPGWAEVRQRSTHLSVSLRQAGGEGGRARAEPCAPVPSVGPRHAGCRAEGPQSGGAAPGRHPAAEQVKRGGRRRRKATRLALNFAAPVTNKQIEPKKDLSHPIPAFSAAAASLIGAEVIYLFDFSPPPSPPPLAHTHTPPSLPFHFPSPSPLPGLPSPPSRRRQPRSQRGAPRPGALRPAAAPGAGRGAGAPRGGGSGGGRERGSRRTAAGRHRRAGGRRSRTPRSPRQAAAAGGRSCRAPQGQGSPAGEDR